MIIRCRFSPYLDPRKIDSIKTALPCKGRQTIRRNWHPGKGGGGSLFLKGCENGVTETSQRGGTQRSSDCQQREHLLVLLQNLLVLNTTLVEALHPVDIAQHLVGACTRHNTEICNDNTAPFLVRK